MKIMQNIFWCKRNGLDKVNRRGVNSPIAKFFTEEEMNAIIARTEAKVGDVIMIVADRAKVVYGALGAVRLKLGKELGLINNDEFKFLWVVDFLCSNMMKKSKDIRLNITHSHQ